ncbi:MAG: histidine phosphatase family protein [Oscillospiraceae bacterium]
MRIIFIRHGSTPGNAEKRYIGRTDEPLSAEGISYIVRKKYPPADIVVTSPMRRCVETAHIIYPDIVPVICGELRECDFGDFEGKNYHELSGNAAYQQWIDSGGEGCFPNGEAPADFRRRCVEGFLRRVKDFGENDAAAFVVHGGTIMSVLSELAEPKRSYYDCNRDNGCGCVTEWDGSRLIITEEI